MTPSDIVLQVSALSIDGCITADGSATDRWANEPDDERDRWMTGSLSQASVHVMGATTYRSMAAYWPGSEEIFAEPMNRIPKAVFSRSMSTAEAGWGPVQICSGDTRAELERLRSAGDGHVFAHGGIRFMRSLARLDVVDEYRLVVGPWVSGSGDQLFQGVLEPRRLHLTDLVRFPSGAIAATYRKRQA